MICQNPECNNQVASSARKGTIYCCRKCRTRVKTLKNTEKLRAKAKATPHLCKRCGQPAGYKKVYCEACKVPRGSGVGIGGLTTPRIKAARAREQEAIDRVVAKALANGSQGSIDVMSDPWRARGIRGAKVG